MQKLSSTDIIRLHRLARDGISQQKIADQFGVHRNTVINHLSLRVAYPPSVAIALALHRKLPAQQTMSIYDAAAFLPGWPSRDRTYRLYCAGILCATKHNNKLIANMASIRACARRMMPIGLWIRSDHVAHFASDPESLLERVRPLGRPCRYWPTRKYRFFPAVDLFRAAAELDIKLHVPLGDRTRAAVCLDLCGVATI